MHTYLHHTLVRVQLAELLLDLVHSLLDALLLSQQALLWRQDKEGRKRRFKSAGTSLLRRPTSIPAAESSHRLN